jgi:hypothetical protein
MASNDAENERPILRSVGEWRGPRPDSEMDAIGLGIAAIMLIVVLPLLPFVALIWLLTSGAALLRRAITGDDEPATDSTDSGPGGRGRRGAL